MMKGIRKHRIIVALGLLAALLLGGCGIKDSYVDCPRPFRLYVKAVDADEKDITASGEVKQVVLFVFDANKKIIDAITLSEQQVKSKESILITPSYPPTSKIYFSAWGNVDGSIDFPDKASVKQYSQLYARLKSASGSAVSPSDLFHGLLEVPVEIGGLEEGDDKTIVIRRKTAQVTIAAYGLKGFNLGKEGKYEYRLRRAMDTYDADGNLSGNEVSFAPEATMDSEGHLKAPLFRAFPPKSGEKYVLDILYNGEVIYTATESTDGTSFIPTVGRVLNIVLDFRGELSVKVVITPWNVVYQYVVIS